MPAQAPPRPEPAPRTARRVEAVFLDRDGVINENRIDHVKSWSEFRFLPGAPEAIGRLRRAGCQVFVITNQAIINRGIVTHHVVDDVNGRMLGELDRRGARVEAVAYCPHRPEQDCPCRKPRPALLLKLAQRFGLDLKKSVMIGDALSDIEAGAAVGCMTILVMTGRGREQLSNALATGKNGFLVATDLSAATDLLLDSVTAVAS
jgi:D-glycero-D-manno-heptose 1,7-bisphosphate phosphatase